MISTVFAIAAAYVVLATLLLAMALRAPFAWWVKASAILISSGFFIEVFLATRGLLGYPGSGRLPPHFQLLWARVVEPDARSANPGAVFLWVEEVDANNVPDGLPRSFELPYSRPLAEKSDRARDAIMSGNPQEGTAEDISPDLGEDAEKADTAKADQKLALDPNRGDIGSTDINLPAPVPQQGEQIEFLPLPPPFLPPKVN